MSTPDRSPEHVKTVTDSLKKLQTLYKEEFISGEDLKKGLEVASKENPEALAKWAKEYSTRQSKQSKDKPNKDKPNEEENLTKITHVIANISNISAALTEASKEKDPLLLQSKDGKQFRKRQVDIIREQINTVLNPEKYENPTVTPPKKKSFFRS